MDIADDLALLSHSHAQMQDKTTCLESKSAKIGLHVNNGKTKIVRMQHTSNSPVTVAGQPFEEVNSFTYLGSTVDATGVVGGGGGGANADVRTRIGKAQTAFLILKKVWTSREI